MSTTGLSDRIDRPRRLPDEVASSILASIESKQFLPADKLPSEDEQSKRFGMARTVIREAISLTALQNKDIEGTRVATRLRFERSARSLATRKDFA